jgi:ABC-type lipoprotein export system ATPase subunit
MSDNDPERKANDASGAGESDSLPPPPANMAPSEPSTADASPSPDDLPPPPAALPPAPPPPLIRRRLMESASGAPIFAPASDAPSTESAAPDASVPPSEALYDDSLPPPPANSVPMSPAPQASTPPAETPGNAPMPGQAAPMRAFPPPVARRAGQGDDPGRPAPGSNPPATNSPVAAANTPPAPQPAGPGYQPNAAQQPAGPPAIRPPAPQRPLQPGSPGGPPAPAQQKYVQQPLRPGTPGGPPAQGQQKYVQRPLQPGEPGGPPLPQQHYVQTPLAPGMPGGPPLPTPPPAQPPPNVFAPPPAPANYAPPAPAPRPAPQPSYVPSARPAIGVIKLQHAFPNSSFRLWIPRLELMPGELTYIGGASGSGKSTLIRFLAMETKLEHGDIWVMDRPLRGMAPNDLADLKGDAMTYIPQEHLGLLDLSALENIARVLHDYDGLDWRTARYQATLALRMAGLEDQHHQNRVPRLSGGQKARVAVAKVFARGRPICLSDEILPALDDKSRLAVLRLFQQLIDQGGFTVAIIAHQPELQKYFRRVIEMRDGQIISDKRQQPDPIPLNP